MAATDSDRILAAGVAIKLADGSEGRLRFTLRALKDLEDAFGSLDDAAAKLNELSAARVAGSSTPLVEHLAVFVGAGMRCAPADVLDTVDEHMHALTALCMEAWVEAFPGSGVSGEAAAPGDSPSPGA